MRRAIAEPRLASRPAKPGFGRQGWSLNNRTREDVRVETTWDGLPIAGEKPFAAAVIVWRQNGLRREYLLLHRTHHGPAYEGEWAWTSPAGARQPGEEPRAAAIRELWEETGLELDIKGPVEHVTDEVSLFLAEAPADVGVHLDAEHDRYDWVELEEGVRRCLPAAVAEGLRIADRVITAAERT